MGKFSCFLAGNAEKRKNRKFVVSERFKDESGNPVEWETRSISADEDDRIRKECMTKVPIPGKRGQFTQEFDAMKYLKKLCAVAVVYPDLNDSELQDSYGAMGAEQLVTAMLYKDEFDFLTDKLTETTDTNDINALVDEAKN